MSDASSNRSIVIACGGTGGHLFPGLAVAEQLRERDCAVTLLISPKEVDQQAVKSVRGMDIVTLPAVGLQRGSRLAFMRGFVQSYRAAKKLFRERLPLAALGMGGFTSAPPLLAARRRGARIFLHESNVIPGRANRWLSWLVDRAFVGFPEAQARLHGKTFVVGTPVRAEFRPRNAGASRLDLGLHPDRPVVLVVGGSQGASGLNDAVMAALPRLARNVPELQWIHLTGPRDVEKVRAAYAAVRLTALVLPFCDRMDALLAAASIAISRAGASCLAELAAMRVPSVLVPFPAAADNHQWHNAHVFVESGAARMLEQKNAAPETLARMVCEYVGETAALERSRVALARWHHPHAAAEMSEAILKSIAACRPGPACDEHETRSGRSSGDPASVQHSSVIA